MIKIINEIKNMNVPFTIKSVFLSIQNDPPYDRAKAANISIKPVMPESIPINFPAINEIKYEKITTKIIKPIGLLIILKNNESGPK